MRKNASPTQLGTENIGTLLMQYAVPAIIAMTAASLYNITDSIFIGHGVGKNALTGLGITFPLMNLAAAFGSMAGIGASTLLSIRMGQNDYKSANLILGNVVILNIITGISFGVIALIFLEPVLLFFGASEATLPYASQFMHIILAGNVISHIYFGLNAVLRASGQPEKAMYATLFTVGINLILNPLFIFVFKWGIRGSALATIISQCVMLVWQYSLFQSKDSFLHFTKEGMKLKWNIVKDSVLIGLPPFLMNAASCVIVILINTGLKRTSGDDAVGAYTVVNRVAMLFVMIVIGFNQGMQPIAGYNFGAKKYDRVISVFWRTVRYATVIMISGFALLELFPDMVVSIFTSDPALKELAITGFRIVFISYPIIGFQMVTSNFFQSMGMAKKSIFLSLTRQVLFLIPMLIFLPNIWGVHGVWWSMPISDAISSVVATIMLVIQMRKFKQMRYEE
ncbi:MAG: MATE family efflux transporter [Prevotellaceae bacterium]|jgi:putative MATE family efflux protein|nr:MATE family efflux transporter [Prevotellaceae bacterium]